ncbi:hypothetical protein PSM36_0982 [Proteiniphilum saccharofermentans]|uniref:Uncharacterized protein n=1 Tax=Proteiniphilum saccharofermentans TaxID=1642647 RepID=A0A1R3T3H1_9BACT|nr:hypothetical protein PSM36_0982 [Proteiniphilum saccharofermentans]SFK92181.1 hypothetical protein SAMN05216357_108117 [Porphyromonadaceae bacterium KH3CP3RA]
MKSNQRSTSNLDFFRPGLVMIISDNKLHK